MKHYLKSLGIAVAFTGLAASAFAGERSTARHMENIKDNGPELRLFLQDMPKGGDLHNHLTGAIYAENYIRWAAEDGTCANLVDPRLIWKGKDADCQAEGLARAADIIADAETQRQFINKMSMRAFVPSAGWPGYDHFFDTFPRMNWQPHRLGDMLAEVAERADGQNLVYLELMETFLTDDLVALIPKVGLRPDMTAADVEQLHADLLAAGFADALEKAVGEVKERMKAATARKREVLGCEVNEDAMGCDVVIRFQQQVIRTLDPVVSYLMFGLGYHLVEDDANFVGMNLVAPEHDPRALKYYDLHMRMMQFLREKHGAINIALHAGELELGLVDTVHLKDHIRKAIDVAGATRIGHGIDIAYENDAEQLMAHMRDNEIMVEINLTSNDSILGIKGDDHPVALYRSRGVPVALSTDDEGVSRNDITYEYMRGVREQGFDYGDLKHMSRNALKHSFLQGARLSLNENCQKDMKRDQGPGENCAIFLANNPKAKAQWDLEKRFKTFEAKYD